MTALLKNENCKTRAKKGDRGGDVTTAQEVASFGQARRAPRPIVETGDIISVID